MRPPPRAEGIDVMNKKLLARNDHSALRLLRDRPGRDWWVLRFDGGCDRNGCPDAVGRWAFHLLAGGTRTVDFGSGPASWPGVAVTNNVAEWQGLTHGLSRAVSEQPDVPGLLIEGDSNLVVQVVSGRWASKMPHLTELRDQARDVLAGLGVPWAARWIPREENEFCDALTR